MTSSAEHLPLADVKNRRSEIVQRIERQHGRMVIIKPGRPVAVDAEGDVEQLTKEQALALVRRR